MKKTALLLFLLLLSAPVFAGNGGLVGGSGSGEQKKWSHRGDSGAAAPGDFAIAEDKKYATSAEDDFREPDYQVRGAKNAFNGVITMWGGLIKNALPSNEPLPEKKKPGGPK